MAGFKLSLLLGLALLVGPVFAFKRIRAKLKRNEVLLSWRVNWKAQEVEVEAWARRAGFDWLAVGFSDHGRLAGADLCVWRRGAEHLTDAHVLPDLRVRADQHQDCRFRALRDDHARRRVRFVRRLVTCDPRDYAVDFGTTQFVVALGRGAPASLNASGADAVLVYNSLLDQQAAAAPLEPDAQQLAITARDAHVPAQVTTYWCGLLELPAHMQQRKHHAVRFAPLIQKGNHDLVHHMEIYYCDQFIQPGTKYNGQCVDKPKQLKSCSKVIAAWAMGAEILSYPKEAGMPIGGRDSNPFIMVEIHYNNPFLMAGRVDNSGFTISVTPTLRPFDAGIIEFGLIYSDANSIPAGQDEYSISGFCVPQCSKHLPEDGIHIFATQQHAHLTGRKIRTTHYRNGVKLGYINKDDHYSPHWQVIRQLKKHVHVLPGDVVQTTCDFETRDLKNWTWGGYGIEDEMCVNYVFYYPISQVEVCKSAISNKTLDMFFAKHLPNQNLRGLGIHEKYLRLKMDQELADELSEWYDTMPLKMDCLNHAGELLPGDFEHVPRPETFAGAYEKTVSRMECPALNR